MARLDSCSGWLCLVAGIGLSACGGVSRIDGPDSGNGLGGSSSSGADGAGRGGAATAGEAAGGASSAGAPGAAGTSAAGAGSAGASACTSFEDQAPQPVTVTIRNGTPSPAYIGSRVATCGQTPLFDVTAGGVALVDRGPCGTPCQGYLDGVPAGGCLDICQLPVVTKLAPGEIITTEWSGQFLLDTQLPKECNREQDASDAVTCSVEKRVAPADYVFEASAGSAITCTNNPSGCTECQPAATGGCTLPGATVVGSLSRARRTVTLDASYGIDDPSAGGSGAIGQNRVVDLVLEELAQ